MSREREGFFKAFAGAVAAALLALVGLHVGLAKADLLAPPPFVATNCIDAKLDYLAGQDLSDVSLMAVGSSATWRNLDMRAFPVPEGRRAVNAAPCYLHVDQTAFLADFLAERTPALQTLVMVTHPRDFEACPPSQREFFNLTTTAPVFDGSAPRWSPYVTGFRPIYLLEQARLKMTRQEFYGTKSVEDGHGSSALAEVNAWDPPLAIDRRCFDGLKALDAIAAERGLSLIVAILPDHPAWAAARGLDRLDAWAGEVKASVQAGRVIDMRDLDWPAEAFADPVHLLHPRNVEFSAILAERMRGDAAARERADAL